MSQQLINHSPDLKKLRDEGYELEIKAGYLLVHNIPYVNAERKILRGTLVSELTLKSNIATSRPETHVISFIGQHPCNKDGSTITAIQHTSQQQDLGNGIIVQHSFSNKPQTGYADYYSKIERYADIISAPAKSLDPSVKEKMFNPIFDTENTSVFQYIDTNSSRANINKMNAVFDGQKIAIIGLGGTGAYILDLVAKTQVSEIHLFDGDDFLQHNAFRIPGAASADQLKLKQSKVAFQDSIYSNLHKGIVAHEVFINAENLDLLAQMTFVFIAVDRNSTRKLLCEYLLERKISFIDVGLGVIPVDNNLIGTIRCTACTAEKNDHLSKRISMTDNDEENMYALNIQIADLNALNAALAVIKWKKISGFYQDLEKEHHSTYSINVAQLINEDHTA